MSSGDALYHPKSIGPRELIVLIALLMSLNALCIDGMLPALDDIARELGAEAGNQRQLIVGVYLLANGIGCLLPGSFADRFGRKPVILVALAAYAVFSLIVATVDSFFLLLVARGFQGLLCAGLMVAPMAIVRDQFEGDKMARTMSSVSAVFITVPVIAPSLGQAVLLIAGWRWIFVGLACLAGLAALWTWIRLPETLHPENRQRIDVRAIVGEMPLLVPGVGAQGGDVEAVVRNGATKDGAGLVISSSRAILYAGSGLDFADAARAAALELRGEINRHM